MVRTSVVSLIIGVCIAPGVAYANGKFQKTRVYLEQNVSDQDAEVVFEAKGGASGLAALSVTAPDGRTVIDFKAGQSKLGIRSLVLESPEPKNDGRVQRDFPAGVYKFAGRAVDGAKLQGEARLSHRLPAPVTLLRPRQNDGEVPVSGLDVAWTAAKDLSATIVEIEDERTGRGLTARLPGDVTSFIVPDGLLHPGVKYKLAVGTVSKEGNASFIETEFTTMAQAGTAAQAPAAGSKPAGAKIISEEEAKRIALKAVPGKAREVSIENKLGGDRYVVEVLPSKGGPEVDVIIEMTTGKVLGLEK